MRLSLAIAACLLSGVCQAQSPVVQTVDLAAGNVRFEIADVHSSPHIKGPIVRGPFFADGRYELRFATMLDLIRIAYDLDPARVFGGPSWLEWDRYDVFAKVPPGSNVESRRRMLRSLLAERFHLALHADTKPVAAWVLTVASRRQMSESDDSGETGCRRSTVQNAAPASSDSSNQPSAATPPVIQFNCRNTTMEVFAAALPSMTDAGPFDNKPVIDQTGLKGGWDFSFHFTPRMPGRAPSPGADIPVFDALREQLGLGLNAANVPRPVVVVDSVNRTPGPNTPDLEKSFPNPATEFEVASVKPSPPGGGPYRQEIRNGRINLTGVTLRTLIGLGWRIYSDEMLVGAPKWLNEDRFDVVAKAPAGVVVGDFVPDRAASLDNMDAIRPMIRALVIERFSLESHSEERLLNMHVLTAPKAKLTRADPAGRTGCVQRGLGANVSKNVNPALGRVFSCQNMTMAEFAEVLPGLAPLYLHTDVVDATGLEGGWDFTFGFSGASEVQAATRVRSADGTTAGPRGIPEASEPSGAMSLFEALNMQLGLKLDQMEKRPARVLVIGHIERKPVDN